MLIPTFRVRITSIVSALSMLLIFAGCAHKAPEPTAPSQPSAQAKLQQRIDAIKGAHLPPAAEAEAIRKLQQQTAP